MALYLHVGHGKTGSSALQAWLSLNAADLWSKHEVFYPQISPISGAEETEARQLKFSMGNGFILHDILQADDPLLTLKSFLPDLGASGKLLFSREAFVRELSARLDDLICLAADAGLGRPHVLLFLRDPMEHAHSLYGQMVKAHGLSDGISEWLPRYNLLEAVETFLHAIASQPTCALTVHNYSRAPTAIFEQFATWLGGSEGRLALQAPPDRPINRTLCGDEVRFMRLLNRRFGRGAATIGRRLVDLPAPPHATPYRVPRQAQEQFLERLGPIVTRLNSQLPPAAALKLGLLPDPYSSWEAEPEAEAPISLRLMPDQIALVLEGLAPLP